MIPFQTFQKFSRNINNQLFYFNVSIVRDVVRVIRSCASIPKVKDGKEEKNTCYKTVMEEYNTYVCTCTEDGCNGAENIKLSALLITIIPIITLGLFNH